MDSWVYKNMCLGANTVDIKSENRVIYEIGEIK